MNKIAIDFTFTASYAIEKDKINGSGSITIFLADILDGIARLHKEDSFIIFANSATSKRMRERFPDFKVVDVGGICYKIFFSILKKKQRSRLLKRAGLFNRVLKRHGIEKIWFPWMVPEETAGVNIEYVGTCHDLKMRWANSDESCKVMFENALHTITISDFVRNEIIETYGIDGNLITPIYNGLSLAAEVVRTSEIKELEGKKFILGINAYAKEKNAITLLKAFNKIKDQIDLNLVLCGGYKIGNTLEELQKYVRDSHMEDRVTFYFNISETEKNWLLKNCTLFVTASENEGFGRTPIEAALCSRPVISTRATSLEEVTAGLVHYYDNPRDETELSEKILDVIKNPDTPERLEYIRNYFMGIYSVEAVAQQYLDFFESIGWI